MSCRFQETRGPVCDRHPPAQRSLTLNRVQKQLRDDSNRFDEQHFFFKCQVPSVVLTLNFLFILLGKYDWTRAPSLHRKHNTNGTYTCFVVTMVTVLACCLYRLLHVYRFHPPINIENTECSTQPECVSCQMNSNTTTASTTNISQRTGKETGKNKPSCFQ